ncbi:putative E3 ubiquitin-protein ligase DTX4-like [Scophthalmus maximus]|uniref:E3 ubiquitin-protein ligase n=1 Tax=Scophthalmus maximus TaxID=52904 RepID=A0A2U9B112_SCOMX|nr:putative E3 ubiquitin-protein ligase DTX4-like [Scophthalmus maximus]
MLLASAVVVWEWLNEHGRWRPYSPAVCHHIEAVIRSDPRCGSVVLGQVDPRLSPYIIDLHSMHQFRQDTGTLRPVRRSFYDPTSAPGQGWLWEWENDAGSWTAYDTEVGIAIQAARDRQQPWLDLAPLGFCYLIDFESMTQINGQTQRCRRIQCRSDLAYPLVSGPLPRSHHAWGPTSMPSHGGLLGVDVSGPCACQQCMLVLSVKAGTMSAAHTLGRRPPQFKPPSPKIISHHVPGGSTSFVGATATAALSISSTRPPPPPLPPPPPPPPPPATSSLSVATSPPHPSTSSSLAASCSAPTPPAPGPVLISTSASTCTPSPSARVLGPVSSSAAAACAAPLPPRSSLAGLSRPALQRIAMAQSRALIASGVPTVPVKNLNGSSPVHPALAGITGILMSAAGLPVCLTRPPKLVLHPPPVSKSDIKPVPGLGHCCRKTTKKQARKGKTPEEVVKRYLQKVRNPPEEDCTICMEALAGPSGYKGPGVGGISRAESVGRLAQCGHQYHLQCLVAMYNNGNKDGSLQCPTCKTIYGVKTGNQPPGKMEYHVIPHSLPGHPDCKTIRIIYNIPPGIQGPEHPNPGKPFTARGFPRHCYLPDSEKGRKVLRLLLVAWDRRLIFSVGTSSTTGESDTVIWNEVHHKTEFGSNLTGHGYPDPGHLDNVLEELKAQGITEEECLPRD